MKLFGTLLDTLAFEPRRNAKITLIVDYLAAAPDPDRGFALAALCGALDFPAAKPAMLKALVAERVDPVLFALSYDFVGDLSETIALIWPKRPGESQALRLADIATLLVTGNRRGLAATIALWLDGLDETGRWALLKLVTGGLRVGVSASLARQALAQFGGVRETAIEEIWHGLTPPYAPLFAWLEGRAPVPDLDDALTFRSPMLAHALDEASLAQMRPEDFAAEWKWDGIRAQLLVRTSPGKTSPGKEIEKRLFSRSGDDITAAFPDLLEALTFDAVIDGELVVMHEGAIGTFNALQRRLNRKQVSPAMLAEAPAGLMAYDLLFEAGEDLRALPFDARRQRLEAFVRAKGGQKLAISPLIPFAHWDELAEKRAQSGENPAIEGIMLKRLDSPYVAGRPKGLWHKWKRDAKLVDCVMMYAQRGHGKRSSYYSDFTFGVWDGESLVPVGKAYFGFTDAELLELDRFVRHHTTNRFGPVREVAHKPEQGLVLEIAFEGLQASSRHKSGIAMRFPRINRIRHDKLPRDADRIELLRTMLA